MAAIPKLRGLRREDYADAPAWFGRFLEQMNSFLTETTDALAGKLDNTNFREQIETIEVTTDASGHVAPLTIKNKIGVAPTEVRIGAVRSKEAPFSDDGGPWTYDPKTGQIRIRSVGLLGTNTKYYITFVIS